MCVAPLTSLVLHLNMNCVHSGGHVLWNIALVSSLAALSCLHLDQPVEKIKPGVTKGVTQP